MAAYPCHWWKNQPNEVKWTDDCNTTVFKKLKTLLCSTPVLQSPDFTKDFVLQTDASNIGVGAVLSQLDGKGLDHPIEHFSKKLSLREIKYATVEKEYLAIKLEIEAFHHYLTGYPFMIESDHAPVTTMAWEDKGYQCKTHKVEPLSPKLPVQNTLLIQCKKWKCRCPVTSQLQLARFNNLRLNKFNS